MPSQDTHTTPVCIVGAGPAGITAALHLQKAGVACLLVDRAVSEREHLRGEVFDGRVLHALRRLDSDFLPELHARGMFVENRGATFIRENGKSFSVQFPEGMPPRLLAMRAEFDAFLREKVANRPGVTVLHDTEIDAVDVGPDKATLHASKQGVTIEAQLIIDASGCLSRLGQVLRREEQRGQAHVWVSQCFADVTLPNPTDLLLHPLPRWKTVLMVSPLPDNRIGLGLGIRQRDLQSLCLSPNELLEKAVASLAQSHPTLTQGTALASAKGTVIRLSRNQHRLYGERYLLAGAAGYGLNPVSGFGVGHAMTAGELAAQQAVQAIQHQEFSVHHLRTYQQQVYQRLRSELRLSQLITYLLAHPRVFVPLVFRVGSAFSRLLTTPAFTRNYRKPSFYMKMLFSKS